MRTTFAPPETAPDGGAERVAVVVGEAAVTPPRDSINIQRHNHGDASPVPTYDETTDLHDPPRGAVPSIANRQPKGMSLPTSSTDTPLPTPDPEFGAQVAASWSEIEDHPEWFVRVVCNPFLAFAVGVLWLAWILDAALRGWARELLVPLGIVSAALLCLALPRLCRYHCLDCGHSAPVREWRRHLCPSAAGRRLSNQPRRWRGPLPHQQFWIAFLMAWLMILLRCALR